MLVPRFKSVDEYLTFIINRRIGMLCGAIMLAGIVMIGSWYWTAFENIRKYQQLDIVDTGRIHLHEKHPQVCSALERNGRLEVRDLTPYDFVQTELGYRSLRRDYCQRVLSGAREWRRYQMQYYSSTGENLFFSVFLTVILLYGWSVLIALSAVIGFMLTNSFRAGVIAGSAALLPFAFGVGVFLSAAWAPRDTSWDTSAGRVETYRVYISRNGALYRAPDHLFEWTESSTLSDLSKKARVHMSAVSQDAQ